MTSRNDIALVQSIKISLVSDFKSPTEREDQLPSILYHSCSVREGLANGVSENAYQYFFQCP